MPDPLTRAVYCLNQSQQCLTLAEAAEASDLKVEYRRMAQEYLELANAEKRMALRLAREQQ
jgi:hypothetical protein